MKIAHAALLATLAACAAPTDEPDAPADAAAELAAAPSRPRIDPICRVLRVDEVTRRVPTTGGTLEARGCGYWSLASVRIHTDAVGGSEWLEVPFTVLDDRRVLVALPPAQKGLADVWFLGANRQIQRFFRFETP